jgi:hypothetical protein
MKTRTILVLAMLVVTLAFPGFAIEKRALQFRDDFGMEPAYEGALQYYYFIPCPTYSWFWAFTGWDVGDIIGEWFQVGDMSTGGFGSCDPEDCQQLKQFRVLDFAGYGQTHAGLFTIEFDVYCADEHGCPVGPSLWNSARYETGFGWNYIVIDPPISICGCAVIPGPPPSGPRIVVTVTNVGTQGRYPAWGLDNISTPVQSGCEAHDLGCLPMLYPRPYSSHYSTMHSGYYGNGGFAYCPPQWFLDVRDTTSDGTEYGFIELCWRLYLVCAGPTEVYPTTWGSIKSIYR